MVFLGIMLAAGGNFWVLHFVQTNFSSIKTHASTIHCNSDPEILGWVLSELYHTHTHKHTTSASKFASYTSYTMIL